MKGDVADEIRKLKNGEGSDIHVYGSGELCQTLLQHDLVDELGLRFFPVTLGSGKRLFGNGTIPANFRLIKNSVSPSGVIIASYARDGDLPSGSSAA